MAQFNMSTIIERSFTSTHLSLVHQQQMQERHNMVFSVQRKWCMCISDTQSSAIEKSILQNSIFFNSNGTPLKKTAGSAESDSLLKGQPFFFLFNLSLVIHLTLWKCNITLWTSRILTNKTIAACRAAVSLKPLNKLHPCLNVTGHMRSLDVHFIHIKLVCAIYIHII